MELKTAKRTKIKLKIGLSAPSGCGKTYSALLLAKGLASSWDKIAVIDSENGSASLYAHLGPYKTIDLRPPFDAQNYLRAFQLCQQAGMEVIIIDSLSHFWQWCNEYNNELGGNSYVNWGKTNKFYERFIKMELLQGPQHVICCMRRKTDYEQVKDEKGKTQVRKIGLKHEMRENFEYELSVLFGLAFNHKATAEKDRTIAPDGTSLFLGKPDFVITEETGKKLLAWLDSAEDAPPAPPKPEVDPEAVAKMVKALGTIGITKEALERTLGHGVDAINPEQLTMCRDMYTSIKAGKSKPADWLAKEGSNAVV